MGGGDGEDETPLNITVEAAEALTKDRVLLNRLWILNVAGAVLHAAQAIASTVLLVTVFSGKGYWGLTRHVFGERAWSATYRVAWFVPAFFIVSALTHAAEATCRRARYEALIREMHNPARWVEYSLSAGIMLWLIANLSGVSDPLVLAFLVLLNVVMQYSGHRIERACRNPSLRRPGRDATRLGWAIHLVTWCFIFVSFFQAVRQDNADPPTLVWAIAPTLFVLFTLFGVPLAMWQRLDTASKTTETYARRVEIPYIVLSLVAKSVLGWFVIGGALRGRDEQA